MPNTLIVAATSARGYAQAAQNCGYKVITLDAFADADTRSVSEQSFQVRLGEEGVDVDDFKQVFSSICLDDVAGFLYGSLFDAKPELLSWVAERDFLIGNSPEIMQTTKSLGFFGLLDVLKIRYPEVRLEMPNDIGNWLVKKISGTGGTHVKPAAIGAGDYYQRKVEGESVSMLFVADGQTARIVGFNRQLLAPTDDMPYRFAGAVSNLILPEQVQQQFIHAAQQLTEALGLRGINSIDAVLEGDKLWFLEINPRLSATFHLYPNLLKYHIQACAGEILDLPVFETSKAQLTVYAYQALEIPADYAWPEWVADIPYMEGDVASVKVSISAPICTVLAEAENAIAAHKLVLQRAEILAEILKKEAVS